MHIIGIATSQFISVEVVFAACANGSEKLVLARKKYSMNRKEQESLCIILFASVTINRTSFGFHVYL